LLNFQSQAPNSLKPACIATAFFLLLALLAHMPTCDDSFDVKRVSRTRTICTPTEVRT
jgi:hypothetical protein